MTSLHFLPGAKRFALRLPVNENVPNIGHKDELSIIQSSEVKSGSWPMSHYWCGGYRATQLERHDRIKEEVMRAIAAKDTVSASKGLTPTARVASWSARHRWWVLAATVLMLIAAIVASSVYEPQIQDGDAPVGEFSVGADILDSKFPHGSDASEALLFSHPELGVEDPSYRSKVEALVQDLLFAAGEGRHHILRDA